MVVWNRGSNVCAGDFGDFTGHVIQILMNGPETNLALLLQFGGNRTKIATIVLSLLVLDSIKLVIILVPTQVIESFNALAVAI